MESKGMLCDADYREIGRIALVEHLGISEEGQELVGRLFHNIRRDPEVKSIRPITLSPPNGPDPRAYEITTKKALTGVAAEQLLIDAGLTPDRTEGPCFYFRVREEDFPYVIAFNPPLKL